ncbi:hypothetical protein NC651_015305 [Populus alba x Populus x berolinensis]|nr:hypothetical protein NC651_015305 [Populus alba x Populus x berolinensis]
MTKQKRLFAYQVSLPLLSDSPTRKKHTTTLLRRKVTHARAPIAVIYTLPFSGRKQRQSNREPENRERAKVRERERERFSN